MTPPSYEQDIEAALASAFLLFLCARLQDGDRRDLWRLPINDKDRSGSLDYAPVGTVERLDREKQEFGTLTLGVSSYVVEAISNLCGTVGREMVQALLALSRHRNDDCSYGTITGLRGAESVSSTPVPDTPPSHCRF